MFSLFKRKDDNIEAPEWAQFFKDSQYAKYIFLIRKYFERKNAEVDIEPNGLVKVRKKEGIENYGIANLAQVCYQENESEWEKIIEDHFTSMERNKLFEDDFNKHSEDFEYIKPYLGVRIYQREYIETIGFDKVISREIAHDIYAMLVFDFPTAIRNVKPDEISKWDQTEEQLFEIGKANIQTKYPLNISNESLGEFNIQLVGSDGFFTPNIIFDIDKHIGLVGSKGCLIGIPHRHAVLIYPIENLEVVKAVNSLTFVVSGMSKEGPGTISSNLYWYNHGRFLNLPYKIEESKLNFTPPEEFVAMLNTLVKV